ncbi:MAG: 16S rRNA (cytosine(1402)-N(4))-methyltransferase RsmH [Fibrobacterota bacterium]
MEAKRYHIPVLLTEVLGTFREIGKGTLIDGTLGGGGHAAALLAHLPSITLLGLDKDLAALNEASQALAPFGSRARLLQAGFETLPGVVKQEGITDLMGVLLDLGISSRQIDDPARGFSFSHEGPLDMRFSGNTGESAEALVNHASEERLTEIFRDYGEERRAAFVARAIVSARREKPIRTTGELARLVESAAGGHVKARARAFQALRIAVNHELQALDTALDTIPSLLCPGGRFAVIAYHSLEDRRVKQSFRARTGAVDRGRVRLPGDPEGEPAFCAVTKKAVISGEQELRENPRSRSAKLRVLEKA